MLRQTPETSIGTSIVKKKDTQGIQPLKRKNGRGIAQSDRKGRGIQWSVYGCVKKKMKTPRPRFWIGLHLS